jgi:hypothetical protein
LRAQYEGQCERRANYSLTMHGIDHPDISNGILNATTQIMVLDIF